MRDLQKYWQDVRTLAASLPAFMWLVSLEDPKRGMRGGRIAEVAAETAAKLLQSNSHRRATAEEIEVHREGQAAIQRAAFHERLRVKGITVVPMEREN
jgi:hypothetical protein